MSATAPGGGGSATRCDERRRDAGLAEELGQARRLVGGEHDPRAARRPSARPRRRAVPCAAGRQAGSRQPKGSPEVSPPPRRHRRRPLGLGFPGQLERPRADAGGASSRAAAGTSTASPSAGRRLSTSSARRSSAWRHRKSAASARSPGSSRTRSVPGSRWSKRGRRREAPAPRPRPRRRPRSRAARASASEPSVAIRPRTGRGRPPAARAGAAPRGPAVRAIATTPPAGSRNSLAGSSATWPTVPIARWSVGSKARSESISSPKNSMRTGSGCRRREHVDDTAAPRELAAAGDLEAPARSRGRTARAGARPGGAAAPRCSDRGSAGQVVGREGVLEERLDAGDEDAGAVRCARRRGPRRGRRSRRRRARCARRRGRSAARGRRSRRDRRARPPSSSATRSPISASRAIQTSALPGRGRRERRGEVATWRRAGPSVGRRGGRPGRAPRRPSRGAREALANEPVAASSGGRPRGRGHAGRRRRGRRRGRRRRPRARPGASRPASDRAAGVASRSSRSAPVPRRSASRARPRPPPMPRSRSIVASLATVGRRRSAHRARPCRPGVVRATVLPRAMRHASPSLRGGGPCASRSSSGGHRRSSGGPPTSPAGGAPSSVGSAGARTR